MYEYVDVSPPRGREEVDVCIAATYSRPCGKDVYDENPRQGISRVHKAYTGVCTLVPVLQMAIWGIPL